MKRQEEIQQLFKAGDRQELNQILRQIGNQALPPAALCLLAQLRAIVAKLGGETTFNESSSSNSSPVSSPRDSDAEGDLVGSNSGYIFSLLRSMSNIRPSEDKSHSQRSISAHDFACAVVYLEQLTGQSKYEEAKFIPMAEETVRCFDKFQREHSKAVAKLRNYLEPDYAQDSEEDVLNRAIDLYREKRNSLRFAPGRAKAEDKETCRRLEWLLWECGVPLSLWREKHVDFPWQTFFDVLDSNYELADGEYSFWLKKLERFLRPQKGWNLGGWLARTGSSLSTRNQYLITMLRRDPDNKKLAKACLTYWQAAYGLPNDQTTATTAEGAWQVLLASKAMPAKNKDALCEQEREQFAALQEIANDYCEIDEGKEGVKPTHIHHLWTGSYYRGKHHDAAFRNIIKRTYHQLSYWFGYTEALDAANDRRVKRHFMAVCERLAIVDPNMLHRLKNHITGINATDTSNNLELIQYLHQNFVNIEWAYFQDLKKIQQGYLRNLTLSYVETGSFGSEITQAIEQLIELLLVGHTRDDKHVQRLLAQIRAYNQQDSTTVRVQLSDLLQDCEYYHKKLNQERALMQRNLRDLKKDINRLAQDLDVPLHIVHAEKEDKLRYQQQQNLAATLHYENLIKGLLLEKNIDERLWEKIRRDIKHNWRLTDEQRAFLLRLKSEWPEAPTDDITDDDILAALSLYEKKYRYFASPYRAGVTRPAGVSREKQRRRAIKKRSKSTAAIVSVLVGIGEGAVAAIGFSTLIVNPFLVIPLAVFVGVAAFYCNKVLVEADTYDTLNTLFFGGLFKDDEGQEVSFGTKIAVGIFGSLSIGTGFCYGALSAMCLSERILVPVLSSMFAPKIAIGLAIVLSTGPLGATGIGLAAMFFVVIADLIKNRQKRWQSVKNFFIHAFCRDMDLWLERRKRYGLLVAILGHGLHVAFCLGRLTIALTLTAIITVASFGLFYSSGLNIMHLVTTASWAQISTKALSFMNGIVTSVFGLQKNLNMLDRVTLGDALIFIPKVIVGAVGLMTATLEVATYAAFNALSYCVTWGKYTPFEVKPAISGFIVRGIYSGLEWVAKKANITLWRPTRHTPVAPQEVELAETSQADTSDTKPQPAPKQGGCIQRKAQEKSQYEHDLLTRVIDVNSYPAQTVLFAKSPAANAATNHVTGGVLKQSIPGIGPVSRAVIAAGEAPNSAAPQYEATKALMDSATHRSTTVDAEAASVSPPTGLSPVY